MFTTRSAGATTLLSPASAVILPREIMPKVMSFVRLDFICSSPTCLCKQKVDDRVVRDDPNVKDVARVRNGIAGLQNIS
jgi:hypothetical protein